MNDFRNPYSSNCETRAKEELRSHIASFQDSNRRRRDFFRNRLRFRVSGRRVMALFCSLESE